MAINLSLDIKKIDVRKNKQLLIGIIVGIIAVWVGYNHIYKPGMNNLGKLKGELGNESINKDISKRLSMYQGVLAGQRKYFGRHNDVLWLMDQVSKAANSSGLNIVSLTAQAPSTCSYFLVNSVNLVAGGSYHQLGDFVSAIEGLKGFVRIERLFFSRNNKELSANITISTYFWK